MTDWRRVTGWVTVLTASWGAVSSYERVTKNKARALMITSVPQELKQTQPNSWPWRPVRTAALVAEVTRATNAAQRVRWASLRSGVLSLRER